MDVSRRTILPSPARSNLFRTTPTWYLARRNRRSIGPIWHSWLVAEWNGVELDGLVLHSGRLTLRPWQPSDATAVQAILADERMHPHLALPQPYTAADAVDFTTQQGVAGRAEGSRLDCAVAENTTGRLVGSATLTFPVAGRVSAEIGYWISTSDWGRGYATEAARTLARFGFSAGLPRIQIRCEVPNTGSAVVALRAGFGFETVSRASLNARGADSSLDAAVFVRTAGDPDEPVRPSWPALPALSDGVVTLRPTEARDWPVLMAEADNEESLRWALHNYRMTEAIATRLAARAGLDRLVGDHNSLIICEAATGAGAGTMGLRRAGPPDVIGIGYGVLPEFRGRGFTARALRLLADWAFSQTPIVRLELGCKVANVASARAAEAAGFTRDALMASRLRNPDGSYSDEIGFGLVRPGS
jgi:RimJ/RimL family protein N-acetyltransferase